jgi:hypothetical protein
MVFTTHGKPLTTAKLTPGSTATGWPADCTQYTERIINFDTGFTAPTAGDWLQSITGTAFAQVVSSSLTSGAWSAGGTAAGIMRIKSWNGVAWTDNDTIRVAATNVASINGAACFEAPDDYLYKGQQARSCLVQVETQTALIDLTGGNPNQVMPMGLRLDAGQNTVLDEAGAISSFRCIDFAASTATSVYGVFYF